MESPSIEMIKECIEKNMLTPREQFIVSMRHGIGIYEGTTHTLEQVGNKFDITRERVRQILGKAYRKMMGPLEMKKLRNFIE